MPVAIKLDAFDFSVYGSLSGSLSYISSDTLTEQAANGQSSTYYRAQVRIDPKSTSTNPKLRDVVLKPGMTATVDIRTDSRTVLKYLAKPIFKAFSGAMNER
jgi:adhesin transport system membrane fusion protein